MANYTTDADLEAYIPDILDHGIPGVFDGGLKTTLSANAAAGAGSVGLVSVTGLQAGDFLKLDIATSVEIIEVGSIDGSTVALEIGTTLRKKHKAGAKAFQVNDASFASDHEETKKDIDRIVDLSWYRSQVRARTGMSVDLLNDSRLFNPDLMLNAETQLKKLAAFRCLGEYVCPKLAKFVDENDVWGNRAKFYREKFNEELERVLAIGIDYDWDSSGVIEHDEKGLGTSGFRIRRA